MKPRSEKQGIAKMLQLRTLVIVGGALLAGMGFGQIARAADSGGSMGASNTYSAGSTSRSVKVGLNKSLVIDLPRDARDILVSNPVIADAVIRTPRRIYVTGIAVGQSNVIVFDRAGQQIVALELQVERDSSNLSGMLRRLIPDSDITVEIVSDNIVLSGSVKNAADSRKAQDIANIFANGGAQAPQGPAGPDGAVVSTSSQPPASSVVNMLTIQGEDQVQVRVTIAEVQRSLVKQLGIDWNAQNNLDVAGLLLSAATSLPFAVKGSAPPTSGSASLGSNSAPGSPRRTPRSMPSANSARPSGRWSRPASSRRWLSRRSPPSPANRQASSPAASSRCRRAATRMATSPSRSSPSAWRSP